MQDTYVSLLRLPDDIKIETESSPLRFEEPGTPNPTDARVECTVSDGCLRIVLFPSNDRVKRIRMRFRGDMDGVYAILADSLERASAASHVWRTFLPHDMMPWYFYTMDAHGLNAYGVKTGCASLAYWQCDPKGITLWLDVRCGSDGVALTEPLVCAEVVCRHGAEGEDPYFAAREFCRAMCEKPNLPGQAIYGINNWYSHYGTADNKLVCEQAEYLGQLTHGNANRPYMVMDDGWQSAHTRGYNGGPWDGCNERFTSMAETADRIHALGCRAGLWFRPLRTLGHIPEEAVYHSPADKNTPGTALDPSHPYTLERVYTDARRISEWGFDLIKHDFSTIDIFGVPAADEMHFFDRSKTTAQLMTDVYAAVKRGAGESVVIGCNTINHLAAGIHEAQRSGDDTSGRSYEWTRRNGIHSMMRLPQNYTFFQVDPDCAPFTPRVPAEVNMRFVEAMAMTGCTLFTSIVPGVLTPAYEKRMQDAFALAASIPVSDHAIPLDWTRTSAPQRYLFRGNTVDFDWYSDYDGARSYITWLN